MRRGRRARAPQALGPRARVARRTAPQCTGGLEAEEGRGGGKGGRPKERKERKERRKKKLLVCGTRRISVWRGKVLK